MVLDYLGGRNFDARNLKNIYYASAPMPVALLREAPALGK